MRSRAATKPRRSAIQWQRDGVDISNASGSTYQLVEGDENHKITVHTSLTDDTLQTGDGRTARRRRTVVDVAPTLTVSVTGDAIEGSTLTAHAVQGSDENRDGQLSVAARRRRHQQRPAARTYQLVEGDEKPQDHGAYLADG